MCIYARVGACVCGFLGHASSAQRVSLCAYVYICACWCVCVRVSGTRIFLTTRLPVCVCVYMPVCVCMCVCECVGVCACRCVCGRKGCCVFDYVCILIYQIFCFILQYMNCILNVLITRYILSNNIPALHTNCIEASYVQSTEFSVHYTLYNVHYIIAYQQTQGIEVVMTYQH